MLVSITKPFFGARKFIYLVGRITDTCAIDTLLGAKFCSLDSFSYSLLVDRETIHHKIGWTYQ